MKIKSIAFNPKLVKAGPDDGLEEGEFIVYPSTFIRKPDAYGDVIAPTAFDETLEEWRKSGLTMPGLYGHRMDDPDYFVASGDDYGSDTHGWWVKGTFDLENSKARQTYRLVKGRRLNQLSFAYDVLEEGMVTLEDGTKANELRKVKVHEFSFVPVGANQDTSVVAVKAIADSLRQGTILNSKASLDTLVEARDAISAVISSIEKAAPAGSTDPADAHDQTEASGEAEAKEPVSGEEPEGAKPPADADEPKSSPSVEALAAQAHIFALKGAERGV